MAPWAHRPLPRAGRRQPRGGRGAPRADPSHGLRGQAPTQPAVHFYAAAPVHFYAAAPVHFYAAVDILIEGAGGSSPADYRETAAAQAAASLVGRSLAVATIEGGSPARTGLSAGLLLDLGAALILEGEAVYRIDVSTGGVVTLRRASDWDITGGPDSESWRYRIKIAGPTRDAETILPSAGVFHPRLNCSAQEPHKGKSPIGLASQSARLAAGIERQFGNEANQPSGQVLPAPLGAIGAEPLKELKADLKRMAGRTSLVPSMAGAWGEGKASAPADWSPKRLGFSPPEGALRARESVFEHVLATAGVDPSLFSTGSQTAKREALRASLHSTLQPLADVIATEARAKLMADIEFGFERLFASDVQGRARAFASLTAGGMSVEDAAKATGMA